MKVNYCDIPKLLAGCKPFHGNSMHALGNPDDNGYRVYSYCVEVASVRRSVTTERLERTILPRGQSKTTQRAINLCKKFLPGIDIS